LSDSLSYELSISGASTQGAAWNGAPLAACDATLTAPCVETTSDGVRAHVIGPGALEAGGGKLDVKGGSATRALTLVVRF
jgi:hypothetical protein